MISIICIKQFTIVYNENIMYVNIAFFYDSPEKTKVIARSFSDFLEKGEGSHIFIDIKSSVYDSYDEAYKAVDNALYFYYPSQLTLKFIDWFKLILCINLIQSINLILCIKLILCINLNQLINLI